MATKSLILGLSSVLVPILSVAGFILGVISLQNIRRHPGMRGRGRSIGGIVASLILGPSAMVIIISAIVHAHTHVDMSKVQSQVKTLLQTEVRQQSGVTPDLAVTCPRSEPRKQGTVFDCTVTDTATGRQIQVEVRETDDSGDAIIDQLQPSSTSG
jgi:hypothetical protein